MALHRPRRLVILDQAETDLFYLEQDLLREHPELVPVIGDIVDEATVYQILVQRGWGHRRTVLVQYVVMVACATSASLAITLPPTWQWWVIAVWLGVYGLAFGGISMMNRQRRGC